MEPREHKHINNVCRSVLSKDSIVHRIAATFAVKLHQLREQLEDELRAERSALGVRVVFAPGGNPVGSDAPRKPRLQVVDEYGLLAVVAYDGGVTMLDQRTYQGTTTGKVHGRAVKAIKDLARNG